MKTPAMPEHLKVLLAELRGSERFHALLAQYQTTRLPGWTRYRADDKAEAEWAYLSGKLDGEKSLIVWLLGHEPADRQSG